MDTIDLRLLLGVADGLDCPALAARLGLGETAVRKRLRRLAGAGGVAWLRRAGAGYHLTDRGRAALGSVSQATAAAEAIAALVGVDADAVAMRHVRLVTSVAATGSINGAARDLGLPQPSVSAQLKRIERSWGSTLFDRTSKGVSARPTLVELLPHLQRLEKELSRLSATTTADDVPVVPGGLTVASEFGSTGMVDALRDGTLVDVRQHVVSIPGPDWTPAMLAADICVYADLPLAGLATPAGWDTIVAFEDPAYVLLPKDAGAGRTTVALRELADHDWLTGPAGTRNQRSVLAVCQAAGFVPRIRFTALNGPSGRHILKDGVAVALTSATLVPPGELHTVRLAEDLRVRLTVAWRHGGPAAPTAAWLARWLRDRHVGQLAERRPDLLAALRADPARWPGYALT
ncbi:LysR family transcriptional regulator [Micromonospora sp. C31]|uniref:LysR family transcriptional regulator n=1 Tax=Micromonospora sp. C31 TaxID=2824876 RepID=UPI001B393F19|nr:LysR family transcriptional regulator [Micromonospora sp. C31]MBQ1072361.1 LysR family transcriptional regulator [Micromonospora sp. C31]